jgi:hypothetical protein
MDYAPWHSFRRLVIKYRGDFNVRTFSCLDQFLCLAFAQLTYRESLRDIVACLQAQPAKLYHLGIRGQISKSVLADANAGRNWRIHAGFAQTLVTTARQLYANEPFALDLSQTVYALDSSLIKLCLSLFPWATYRETKAAIKLHTLLDLRGAIPAFVHISDGRLHDLHGLDLLLPEPGAIYVMDRGYLDYERLYRWHLAGSFFVIRSPAHLQFKRRHSQLVDHNSGLIYDQIVIPKTEYSRQKYPHQLRLIRYRDSDNRTYTFITNHMKLPALTICELYRQRWQIELFFKWIKQHLRIKSFFGRSENAVKTQVWTAVSVYVLVAIIRKRLHLELSLHQMLQVLSVSPFNKIPLNQLLRKSHIDEESMTNPNQLKLI